MIASRIITAIMACDDIGSIGKDNNLPDWNCPEDLQHFRETTAGSYLLMGRVTFECLPQGVFNTRNDIVLSHLEHPPQEKVDFVPDMQSLAKAVEKIPSDKKIFLIGGAETVEQIFADNLIDYFILSRIPGTYDADCRLSQKLLSQLAEWPAANTVQKQNFAIHTYRNPHASNWGAP